ncbi:SDR family oxidoreductase [Pseudochrobactrum asaccharolyticum]|uniref:SDR family oxidoreductase n=1 Tax=Pseudochrobactrum asaccharolyticum TaxID=354351 RepID=UPI00404224F2
MTAMRTVSEVLPVTLITGGAKRIGSHITQDLAARGYPVIIHCNRSTTQAEALAQRIRAHGGKAAVVSADLSDDKQVASLMEQAAQPFGPIELLVNNASVFEDDRIGSLTHDLWDRHFAVHVKAPVFLAQAMAEALPEDKQGLIINITDQRVQKLNPQFISYTLSKTALWTATRTLAQALAPAIRVNAIAPGPTLPSERQQPGDFEKQVDAVLLKKAPLLDEFASTIDYLWRTRSVTGQMIALDGGQHLAWETPDIAGISE